MSRSRFSTHRMLWYFTTPGFLASCLESVSTLLAVPPMWNVRIVSWVPGSPMDWAAMMPTASPSSARWPVPRLRP